MSSTQDRLQYAEANREFVLLKCKYYQDVQIWPLQARMNPVSWLTNFHDSEMPYALQLLNSFLYYSEFMVDHLLIATIQKLLQDIFIKRSDYSQTQYEWAAFLNSALFTWIPGEDPSPTDSGLIFVRKARQVLNIQEDNILSPNETLRVLQNRPRSVILLDDFVGSGKQCINAWDTLMSGLSFRHYSEDPRYKFYYCPLLCTRYGYENITNNCTHLTLKAAHILPDNYNVLSPSSFIWSDNLKPYASDVIKSISIRAGIPDTDGVDVNDWRGYHKLGLALGFYHGVPDATLPIFYWDNNGWKPLIRRR